MSSFEECRDLLNIRYVQGEIFGNEPIWTIANNGQFRPDVHKRQIVLDWLTRITLTFAYPPERDSRNPMRECYSPNLTALFRSVDYLINTLGYPVHWFRSFLLDVLANSLNTIETYPKHSPNRQHALITSFLSQQSVGARHVHSM